MAQRAERKESVRRGLKGIVRGWRERKADLEEGRVHDDVRRPGEVL